MADNDTLYKAPVEAPKVTAPRGGDFDNIFKEINTSGKEYRGGMEKIREKVAAEPVPKVPTLTAPPQPQNTTTQETFGSTAMWLATFGSMLTRRPLINSLNASAGVMNSIKENDAEKFKQQRDTWKDQMEVAKQRFDFENQYYKSLSDRDTREAEIYAKMFNNPALDQAAKTANLGNYLAQTKKHMAEFEKLDKQNQLIDHRTDSILHEAGLDPSTANEDQKTEASMKAWQEVMSSTKGGGATLDSGTLDTMADQAIAGDKSVYTNLGRGIQGSANVVALRQRVAEKAREQGLSGEDLANALAEFGGKQSEQKAIGTQAGKIKLASAMLDESLPAMMEAAKKVGLTSSTDFNSLYNAAKRKLSNQDFANFSTQLRAVTSDYAQFLGRGRQTVHSDQEALRILSEDMGITSLQGFVDAVKIEEGNVSRAIDKTQNRKKDKKDSGGWSIEEIK